MSGAIRKINNRLQQVNKRARGGIGTDREVFYSEFSDLFAQEILNYDLSPTINLTYSEAQTAITNSTLNEGAYYKLSDKADKGIILLATSSNSFSLNGVGLFLNADFQLQGDYSDITGFDQNKNIWVSSNEGTYTNNQVVIWNGLHYLIRDDSQFDGNNPQTNIDAYQIILKSIDNGGYILENDFILYDLKNDEIICRQDKRGNIVYTTSLDSFKFGSNDTTFNIVFNNSIFNCINSKGNTHFNFIKNTSIIFCSNDFTGTFSSNNIINNNITIQDTSIVSKCNLERPLEVIVFSGGIEFNGNTCSASSSDFTGNLNMNTDFAVGTLTIPTNKNYIGIYTLINNTAQTITKIISTNIKFRCYVQVGNTQLFSHTAIGIAVADNIVSDAAAVNTIVGRINGSDYLEYEKAGNLYRRSNIVKLI